MYDIHCHVLPKVDDGPPSAKSALEMVKVAYEDGIRHMIVTPHVNHPLKFKVKDLGLEFEAFKQLIKKDYADLEIYLGAENYISRSKLHRLKELKLPTMHGSDYLLVEFARDIKLSELDTVLHELRLMGYKPIVAHIEAYKCVYKHIDVLRHLREEGIHFQCNAMNITDEKDSIIGTFTAQLLEIGLIDFIASDGHGPDYRKPILSKAHQFIQKKYSNEVALRLFETNPREIVENGVILPQLKSIPLKKPKNLRLMIAVISIISLFLIGVFAFTALKPAPSITTVRPSASPSNEVADLPPDELRVSTPTINEALLGKLSESAETGNLEVDNTQADNTQTDNTQTDNTQADNTEIVNSNEPQTTDSQGTHPEANPPLSHEQQIIDNYVSYLTTLETLYTKDVDGYYLQLKTAIHLEDETERDAAVDSLRSELLGLENLVDNEVNKTLYDMQNDLEAFKYDTVIVQTIRDHYYDTKAAITDKYKAELEANDN